MSMSLTRDLLSLTKARLALAVALAALTGYLLRAQPLTARGALFVAGVVALAAGAGCLNNYQDRERDRALQRTRERPLPGERLAPSVARTLGVALLVAGLAGTAAGSLSWAAPAVALAAVVLYNAIYSPLKSRTLLALAPGILCGALPPLIGWLAAGGEGVPRTVAGLMVVFGLWQPPHFWLILLQYGEDYRRAGTPSLLTLFARPQLVRILCAWLVALGMALLALPLLFATLTPLIVGALLADVGVMVGVIGWQLLAKSSSPNYPLLFALLNAGVFLGVALLVLPSCWK
jgi:protoheme IX farnesyltransferase